MSRLAKTLAPWIGGALLGSAVTCSSLLALRIHNSEKWAESERILQEVMSGADNRTDVTVECVDCDWSAFRAQLPPLAFARCHDDVPFNWGWGLECFVHFEGGSCLPADVYEKGGEWRVGVAGRLTSGCS